MAGWRDVLQADPLPWLLDDDNPAVKHIALRQLLDRPADDDAVIKAQKAAMLADPIRAILNAQEPEGYWIKPGAGYSPKYMGTVWQIIFLDQLGADPSDERVRRGCEYVLTHCATKAGGLGCSGAIELSPPSPSKVIHCLNGNLLRALIGFNYLEDERVQGAIDWQAGAITGDDFAWYYQSGTSGPGFACAANNKQPCAWGAVKVMLGLARIPLAKRQPAVQKAIDQGSEFLFSRDPRKADYPMGWNNKPNGSWFKLGFPSGYVADVLHNLEALTDLGYARDPRLQNAIDWLLSKQDSQFRGRWKNEYAYNGKTWVNFEQQGKPSKWVTLRACRFLKAVYG